MCWDRLIELEQETRPQEQIRTESEPGIVRFDSIPKEVWEERPQIPIVIEAIS